jgi:hypothetical protein
VLHKLRGLFKSFEAHDVRYLVIGGIAAGIHGVARNTFDLDILIEATTANAERVLNAMREAGMGTASLIEVDALLGNEVTIFQDFINLDVQTHTPGIAFEEAWPRRETKTYKDQSFHVVCRDDLIASKRAAGRPVDLEDVRLLELDED